MKVIVVLAFSIISVFLNAKTVVHVGNLFDVKSGNLLPEMSVFVENEFITEVVEGYVPPDPEDIYIDLTGYYAFPGLIDMHVHLTSQSSNRAYLENFTLNAADYAIRATKNAEKTLLAGFTTVRNLGDFDSITISLRNAINDKITRGPRIYSSGKTIATTGGHADPTNSLNLKLTSDPGPAEGIINNADDAYKAVRHRYKEDADLIKITATGGVLSNAKDGQGPQMTIKEIEAIVDAAKDYGFKVAAHAHGTEGIKRAVLAGVDSIEHGTIMDGEGLALMKKYGTYYIPTISAGMFVAAKAKEPGYYPQIIVPKALEIGPRLLNTFTTAYKFGIKIAFGTDSGVSYHGENAKEFLYMVKGGMSEMEAIRSATVVASELLGIDDKLGTIESGKIADIIAVNGNPVKDITSLQSVVFVMKEGVIYKSE
ncbi:MAG: amidohydrolase [Gammaproteobacteria bacterium]|nr:amidohydrolase [Gammaproteobacteria bacterium]